MTPSLQNTCRKCFCLSILYLCNLFAIFDIQFWQKVTCEPQKRGTKLLFQMVLIMHISFRSSHTLQLTRKKFWLTNITLYTNQSPLFKDAYSHCVKALEIHFVFTMLCSVYGESVLRPSKANPIAPPNISSRFRSFKRNDVNSKWIVL